MKKLSVYLMLLLGVAVFSSCEDAAERESSPEANPNSHKVYFPDQISAKAIGIEQDTINIPIARVVTNGALTVSLKVVGDKAFSIPASVAFADGESETSFTLSVGEIAPHKKYLVTLEFDKSQTENPYIWSDKTPMLSLNVVKEDYVPYAKGSYTLGLNVTEVKNKSGERIMEYSPMLKWYRIKAFAGYEGFDATFKWDEKENKVTMVGGERFDDYTGFQSGYYHNQEGVTNSMVWAVYDDPECKFGHSDGTFSFKYVWSALMDNGNPGSWGAATDTYTINEIFDIE
jgi:hypothetical protein